MEGAKKKNKNDKKMYLCVRMLFVISAVADVNARTHKGLYKRFMDMVQSFLAIFTRTLQLRG